MRGYNVLACHSTPIFNSDGKAIGSMFLCLNEARTIDKKEQQVAQLSARLAGIAIEQDFRHSSREEKVEMESELTDARLLQKLSIKLIQEEENGALYQKIMDAAVIIMQSQYASMQILCPGSDGHDKLKLHDG